jgi:hypothetical protein
MGSHATPKQIEGGQAGMMALDPLFETTAVAGWQQVWEQERAALVG